MTLSCSRCSRLLEYSGERPSFCAYCGQPLGDPRLEATVVHESVEATLDHHATQPSGPDRGDPENVAGYRLIRPLGRGGMGTVYEAEDSHFGRRVALKLIARSHVASREAVERFRQEGRLASALAHPRCVFVLAADEEDDRPYIVMELMPGTTLTGLVKQRGPLPVAEAVAKILDVIDGLRAAHRLGIIHRDVKPSNCFLDAEGRVKVGDFGLSKSLAGDANLTRTGAFLGTPLYASPEQIRRDPIDARTDVYSVAATLFYLLTGRAPFQQDDAAAAMARIVSDPAPSSRTLRPEVPRSLDQVILKGLEREPSRRWRNLDEFRAALLPFLPGHHSIAGVGLRVAAFLIDSVLVTLLATGLIEVIGRWKGEYHVLGAAAAAWWLYFVGFEGALGWTPGKWLARLRVLATASNEPPGVVRATLRWAVFYALTGLAVQLIGLAHGRVSDATLRPWLLLSSLATVPLVGLAAIASTMRAKNGYRGLHEWASGTRTVVLPRAEHRREAPGRRALGRDRGIIARPMGVIEAIGPYKVRGAVRWEDGRRVLAAEDSGLGREVWVVLRPKGSAAPTAARRDLARPTRPRWLAGGEQGDRRWDAFVAPGGCPLADFAGLEGLSWSDARPILHELADELAAACDDGTLPPGLSVDQVWVEPDGRVEVVDPLGAEGAGPADLPDQRRALELLLRAAALALEGGRRRVKELPTSIKAAVPLHARRILDRLLGVGTPYTTVAEVRSDLEATRDLPTELDLAPRLVRLGGYVIGVLLRFLLAALAAFLIARATAARVPETGRPPWWVTSEWFAATCLVAWPLWAFLTRGGLAGRLTGMALVRSDGALPSRLRCAWREVVIWPPMLALFAAYEWRAAHFLLSDRTNLLFTLALLAWPLADAAHELAHPGRMLHDRLSGTTRVPR